jgi:hypothetical protein
LPVVVNAPGAPRDSADENGDEDCKRNLLVKIKGFGAVLDGVVNFVLLQFLARDVIRHSTFSGLI